MGGSRIVDAIETALVQLAQAGDPNAFGELVRRRHGRVRMLLRRLSGDAALGDDLAQEAFVQAWRRLDRLRQPAGFGAWLRRIAVNTWLQHARRLRIDIEALTDIEAIPGQHPHPARRLDLEAALASLQPAERLCVLLAYDEGMTHPEIAAATGLPLGTVKSHIVRGAGRLRRHLESETEIQR